MLIASRNEGKVPADKEYIKRVCYLKNVDFKPLIDIGFLVPDSSCKQTKAEFRPETEAETYKEETEAEKEKPLSGKPDGALPYIEIISYLNVKSGKNFRASGKGTQSHIHARMEEGFTIDQFRVVIDKKCAQWKGDPKMDAFLRPQTLFAGNFESYLNEKGGKDNGRGDKRDNGADREKVGSTADQSFADKYRGIGESTEEG